MYHLGVRLILASASPRRAHLLDAAGLLFDIAPADIDESPLAGERPDDYVRRLALAKSRAGICRNSGRVVLGADTTVVLDGAMLGKPENAADAARMLEMLSGRTHEVLTGVALAHEEGALVEVASTRVHFLPLSEEEVAWYVATGEPEGKAGAYAIQGRASRFVDWIEGSYSNVVGLPVSLVVEMLKRLGFRT